MSVKTKTGVWGADFTRPEIEAARRSGRLLTLELELSRLCNLRCVYCYASSGKPLENELSEGEIRDALQQALALGTQRVIVLGGGEPLAYPKVWEIMTFLADRGVAMDLFTNGMLLDAAGVRRLRDMNVSPVIKLNSFDPATQDFLAGAPGASKLMRRGLELLLAGGYPDERLPLGVQSVVCRQNLEEMPRIWRWARERGVTPYVEMLTWQGRAREHPEIFVDPEEVRTLFETLSRIDREEFGFEWEPKPPIAALTCRRHEYSCTLTVEGDIIPCPGVPVPCGNIRRQSLAEIIGTSSVVDDLRNVRRRLKGACGRCERRDECYGCRGMAYQATGDYLAADPMCWRCVGENHGA